MQTYTITINENTEGKRIIGTLKKSSAVISIKRQELRKKLKSESLKTLKKIQKNRHYLVSEKSLAKEWLSKEDERWEKYL